MMKASKDMQTDLGVTVRDTIPLGYSQSRVMSFVEAVTNVVVGYGVAVITQILIFPIFDLHTTLAQNLQMGAIFSFVSIARSFALRRLFETIQVTWAAQPAISPFRRSRQARRAK
jgi:hypothetical protein